METFPAGEEVILSGGGLGVRGGSGIGDPEAMMANSGKLPPRIRAGRKQTDRCLYLKSIISVRVV